MKWRYLLLLLFLLFFNVTAHSSEIIIVSDKEIEPYNLAIQGIKEIVKADFPHLHIREESKDIRLNVFAKGRKPRIVIGVGAKTSYLLKKTKLRNSIALYHALLS